MSAAESEPPFLLTERDGPVLIVRLNRPEKRNTLSDPALVEEFVALCAATNADRDVRSVILTGMGSAFSAGGDIKKMRDRTGASAGAPHEVRDNYRNGIQRIPLAIQALEVPIVAAVNGPAIGAGLDLACMCDIRIAADTAKFAESFVKLGLVPGDGGAWFLPRIVGTPRATMLSLTGDTIDAATALEWGLVTQVVPGERLMECAMDLARRIAANPAHALRMTKRLLRESPAASLASLLELSASLQALAHETQDHAEAVQAAIEKRPPVFIGR
jgi:enoyl-CoA hydratase/carnithine racemase